MRGPGYKLTGDVRRTWRCPTCGRERKLQGDVTALLCGCHEGVWMQIVSERVMAPRPLQRPSDVERRPIDFGIEAPPPALAKPEATIVKSALSHDPEPILETIEIEISEESNTISDEVSESESEDDWGDGIL